MKRLCLRVLMSFMLLAIATPLYAVDLDKLPNIQTGMVYDVKAAKAETMSTVDVFQYKGVDIGVGIIYPETGCVRVSYDLLKLSDHGVKAPILDLVTLDIGVWVGYDVHTEETKWGICGSIIEF